MQRKPAGPHPAHTDQTTGSAASAAVRAGWWREGPYPPAPGIGDHVVLARGMPVAPWMRLRPVQDVWIAWLQGLRALWLASHEGLAQAALPASSDHHAPEWDAWQAQHVHAVHFRQAEAGAHRLAQLLADPSMADTEAHLIGHSVGGAAILRYLAGRRAGQMPAPAGHVRSAITLDAAVSGCAGVWSGMHAPGRHGAKEALSGLGAWAEGHGISVLTIANEHDIWSHRAVADLPYVGLRLGPPRDLGAQLNGAVHSWLRRMPQVVEALWLYPRTAEPSAVATPTEFHPS